MNKVQVKLTVLFDGTFWIGIFERTINDHFEVAKITFGAEPKDVEIYNFILHKYSYLKFSNPIIINYEEKTKINPKRMQIIVKKQVVNFIGTKAQLALKKQQEENKIIGKQKSKIKKLEQDKLKLELRQKKRLQNIKANK